MTEIKNKFLLGAVAGIAANIIINILDYILYFFNFSEYLALHIAASIYFPIGELKTIEAVIFGLVLDYILAIILGIATVYFLHYTGTDLFIVKGIAIGTISTLLVDGLLLEVVEDTVDAFDPEHLTHHLLLGVLIAWFCIKFGQITNPE